MRKEFPAVHTPTPGRYDPSHLAYDEEYMPHCKVCGEWLDHCQIKQAELTGSTSKKDYDFRVSRLLPYAKVGSDQFNRSVRESLLHARMMEKESFYSERCLREAEVSLGWRNASDLGKLAV